MKGYIENSFFDVYECPNCNASFVDPLQSDGKVYEYIYKQVKVIPGYERYYRYAELVRNVRNPLWYLCNSESVYWAVQEALITCFPRRQDVNILEIGSGLGYLTYSLNKAGYNTTGLDISEDAVRQAKERYGNYYQSGDLFVLSANPQNTYDCIVMTELIEHVENPTAFIKAALSLLKKGGILIVTTPNKSAASQDTIWQSDFPPVHLWFFAEKSITYMANKLGKKCEFVDFTKYTKKFYGPSYTDSIEHIQRGLPRLTKDGSIWPGTEADQTKTFIFGLKGRYYLSYIRRRLKRKEISTRTTTLCAIISE
jgi:SAM-dependent methyltransferase